MYNHDPNRRGFVKAAGLALFALGLDPIFLTRAAHAITRGERAVARRKTLICIFQRGAADGLSMIVPHGEPIYYRERSRIAIPRPGRPGGVLDLDGFFGMHPAMQPLHTLYGTRELAVVHAVGSPHVTRSHFDGQDYMESGTPGVKSTPDGWANRYLEHSPDRQHIPLRGVAMGSRLPRLLLGPAATIAVDNLETFQILRAADTQTRVTAHRSLYPNSPFGRSMRRLAQLIKMDLGLEIGFADSGGWDTHVNQGASQGQLAKVINDFSQTLAAFHTDLGDRMDDVLILTMSEFGRTVSENRTSGTDHGHGNALLVLGGNTNGGRVLGTWPTLALESRFQGRDLAVTTDFRDLFGEILVKHLGTVDLSRVFPNYQSSANRWLGVLRS